MRTITLHLDETRIEALAEMLDIEGGFDDVVEMLLKALPWVPEEFNDPNWMDHYYFAAGPLRQHFDSMTPVITTKENAQWWAIRKNANCTVANREYWRATPVSKWGANVLVFYCPSTNKFARTPQDM